MDHRDVDLFSFHDPVTGLPAARVWAEGVEWAVKQGREQGGQVAVALLDLDRFDVLADHDGRAADRLLKGAAAAWHAVVDDIGVLARLFGGRFGLLLPGGDLDSALEVVSEMRERTPSAWTCSVGVAVWAGEDADLLTSRADGALVGAKLHGRDRAVVAC